MQNNPIFDGVLKALHRAWYYGPRRDWKKIHKLFARGARLSRSGITAPPSAVTIDGLLVSCDGRYLYGSDGRLYDMHVPFRASDRSPMTAIRKRVGRSTDFGPGSLLDVYTVVGYE